MVFLYMSEFYGKNLVENEFIEKFQKFVEHSMVGFHRAFHLHLGMSFGSEPYGWGVIHFF